MRSRMDLPPTPSSSAGSPSASPPQLKKDAEEDDDNGDGQEEEVLTVNAMPRSIFVADNPSDNSNCLTWPTAFCGKSGDEGVLDPQGK